MADRKGPILPGTAASDYERYLRTDELLSLQKEPADVVHRDEHLFQAVHQSSEIWLKLACTELAAAVALIDTDSAAAATRLIRRACDALQHTTSQLTMLEHMSPSDYAVVRTALGHGAGFDSPGFKAVHKISPQLGAAFERLLQRRELQLIDVYEQGYSLEDVYQLAEQLITLGRARNRVAVPAPEDRRTHHRRQRHRHAGHARRSTRQAHRRPVLPRPVARA